MLIVVHSFFQVLALLNSLGFLSFGSAAPAALSVVPVTTSITTALPNVATLPSNMYPSYYPHGNIPRPNLQPPAHTIRNPTFHPPRQPSYPPHRQPSNSPPHHSSRSPPRQPFSYTGPNPTIPNTPNFNRGVFNYEP